RHTRSKRDWSSDVCSSDLCCHGWLLCSSSPRSRCTRSRRPGAGTTAPCRKSIRRWRSSSACCAWRRRSEERRVGKECRARGGTEDFKEKKTQRTSVCSEKLHEFICSGCTS